METNITISISNLGKAIGTLGWVSERLRKAHVKICTSNTGNLCAFLHYTDTTNQEVTKVLARVLKDEQACKNSEENSSYGFSRYKDGIEYAFASDGECYFSESRWSVFGVNLTDAATKKVEALITEVVAKLRAAWEEN